MAVTINNAKRRVAMRLRGTTMYLYGLSKDLARVQGRIESGHYAGRAVEHDLKPERDRLRMEIDREKAYAERDCLLIVEQYRILSHDNAGADELEGVVEDFVENQLGGRQALGLLSLYFDHEGKRHNEQKGAK